MAPLAWWTVAGGAAATRPAGERASTIGFALVITSLGVKKPAFAEFTFQAGAGSEALLMRWKTDSVPLVMGLYMTRAEEIAREANMTCKRVLSI